MRRSTACPLTGRISYRGRGMNTTHAPFPMHAPFTTHAPFLPCTPPPPCTPPLSHTWPPSPRIPPSPCMPPFTIHAPLTMHTPLGTHAPPFPQPPCGQNSWHTLLKILPCPKLHLRAVKIYSLIAFIHAFYYYTSIHVTSQKIV